MAFKELLVTENGPYVLQLGSGLKTDRELEALYLRIKLKVARFITFILKSIFHLDVKMIPNLLVFRPNVYSFQLDSDRKLNSSNGSHTLWLGSRHNGLTLYQRVGIM